MTSSNGNIFRVTGPLCGEFNGHQWSPLTKASDAELWCFLWFIKQSWGWWFETPSRTLWRHCNETLFNHKEQSWGWWFETPSRTLWRHCNETLFNHKETSCGILGPVAYKSYHCVSAWYRIPLKLYVFLENIVLHNIIGETNWIVIRTQFYRLFCEKVTQKAETGLLIPKPSLCLIRMTWYLCYCPASRTTLVATRFRVAVICPIIQVPHCIRVFFYFVWFVFINHIFQFYYELCTYCNILDIYLS